MTRFVKRVLAHGVHDAELDDVTEEAEALWAACGVHHSPELAADMVTGLIEPAGAVSNYLGELSSGCPPGSTSVKAS